MINILKYTSAIAKSALASPISSCIVTFGLMGNEKIRVMLPLQHRYRQY